MQMNETQRVPASKAKVWAALNDPEILKRCIPGCQSLAMTSPTEMTAIVVVKVGPVKATFSGKVNLSDLDPPNGYRIAGEGSGGVAGFAKGGATVKLEAESADVTNLQYVVDARVGGKLAQLGGRLIDSTAKRLAEEFFENFAAALTAPEAGESGAVVRATAKESKPGWLSALRSWLQVIGGWSVIAAVRRTLVSGHR
jgi:carbon monoxide dehydrogenase subunit G